MEFKLFPRRLFLTARMHDITHSLTTCLQRFAVRLSSLLLASLVLTCALCGLAVEARASRPPVQSVVKDERSDALVAEGVAALERDDLEAAKAAFTRALVFDRRNTAAHTYLGVLADRAGQLAEAERHFAAASASAPRSSQARNNHGAILLRMGRTEEAAAQFEVSLRLEQNQPSALVNLAQIRFASGTPEGLRQSRELFERAWMIAPDAEIARALVVIGLRLGDKASAAASFRRYAEQINAHGDAPTAEPAARAELGAALLAAGLASEATGELQAAADAEPNNVQFLLLLARAFLARKDVRGAGRTLEAAVARGIEQGAVYAALADVYEQSGHVENAIPAMRLAIEREPQNEFYHFRYGMLLTDTKAPAAAVIRLEEALKSFPRSTRLWFALGIAHFAAHKSHEAVQAFEKALEIDARFAPALAYLGMTQAEQGQYKTALAHYERALAVDERLAIVHFLAADVLLKDAAADLARTERHLARAIALDESFAPARLALGKLYQRLNRLTEAAAELEGAIKLEPNLAEAHYQLGRVYVRLKRDREARDALATFKRLSDEQKEQAQSARQEIVRRLANVRF